MSLPVIARIVAETARICLPTVAGAALGRGGDMALYDRRLDEWSRRLLRFADLSLRVEGREHLVPGEAYVVMSNHQSHFDIPALFQALPLRVRMVTKTELFRVPLWGQAMRVAGFVEVDRQDRHQAVEALSHARRAIEAGTSIWIAPEGTRSDDGSLGPFKKGGFHLAREAGARILPVTIDGTRRALRARDWRIRRGQQAVVTVHAPVDPADYEPNRRKDLMERVRADIASALGPPGD